MQKYWIGLTDWLIVFHFKIQSSVEMRWMFFNENSNGWKVGRGNFCKQSLKDIASLAEIPMINLNNTHFIKSIHLGQLNLIIYASVNGINWIWKYKEKHKNFIRNKSKFLVKCKWPHTKFPFIFKNLFFLRTFPSSRLRKIQWRFLLELTKRLLNI